MRKQNDEIVRPVRRVKITNENDDTKVIFKFYLVFGNKSEKAIASNERSEVIITELM